MTTTSTMTQTVMSTQAAPPAVNQVSPANIQALFTATLTTLRGGGGGGGRGGGRGGGGGGFPPQGPALQQLQQLIPQAADIKVGGKLPSVFDGDCTKADKFINEVKAYLCHNKNVAGFNSLMKKVTFTLTLMQGDKVDEWCETLGDFLDRLEDHHNIPALWTFFLQLFQNQFQDTQAYQKAQVDLKSLTIKFPYIDEYVADFEKFIRKAHYTCHRPHY